jgi:acyl-CoA thioesterase-1
MQLPENYGPEYRRGFAALFPHLAKTERVPLLPFLLEGVALDPKLNQADGIHPNAEGAQRVADTVWKALQPLLRASK